MDSVGNTRTRPTVQLNAAHLSHDVTFHSLTATMMAISITLAALNGIFYIDYRFTNSAPPDTPCAPTTFPPRYHPTTPPASIQSPTPQNLPAAPPSDSPSTSMQTFSTQSPP